MTSVEPALDGLTVGAAREPVDSARGPEHPAARYVLGIVDDTPRRWSEHLREGLRLLPRTLFALWLLVVVAAILGTLRSRYEFGQLTQQPLALQTLGMALWLWGAGQLLVELITLVVRDALGTPWPGSRPSTTGLFLRSLLGLTALTMISEVGGRVWVRAPALLVVTALIFGQRLGPALWGLTAGLRALRSLRVDGVLTWLGALRTERPGARRRIVAGRLRGDACELSLEHEGVVARGRDPELLVVEPPGETAAVIARVRFDEQGYRSSGAQLEPDGLPVWILPVEGAVERVAAFRRRLRAAAVVDAMGPIVALVSAIAIGAFLLLAAFRG